ncbi:PEP-CTERM sorting domain-containing protein [Paucibacter sp. Y2R2-4]|uniref:PEP-CTERM sorting domain-containing protein n=1 Tax=Paucibacter sp. Y2R2-4 TaxID=2893553 RepID=UPI0021E4C0C6|nr:PEP-CTERM sorting domain-containing protein [Paucibacter sp. Y2R2-4]MCV2352045.1 PEP-CTERM sorting domain-containing protein [Paucibacter sp. Y2R2-4]
MSKNTVGFLNSALRKKVAAAVLLGAASVGSAQALTLSSQTLNGAELSDLSSPGLLALDLSFFSTAPVALEFELDAADVGQSIAFNSIVKAVGGADFLSDLHLQVGGGAQFSSIGSAYTLSGQDLAVTPSNTPLSLVSVHSEGQNELYLGDPFSEGKADWRIQFGNLQQGERFVLNISQVSAVPEPTTAAILALGLVALFLLSRVRRPD